MKTLNRYSPLFCKNIKLKNRVVVPPMASETSDNLGFVTDKTIRHYENLTKSQVGLVFVEYTFIHSTGRSEEFQIGISTDDHIEGLKKIADVIHAQGSIAGIQLTHSGAKTQSHLINEMPQAPSSIPVPVKDQEMEIPRAMDLSDIKNWKQWFLDSARRAERAGFDLIEIHAAHGYGMNQWLSPFTNKRADEYGGSLQNNMRLLLEIIQEIKLHHPHLLISVRMPGQDFTEGGLTIRDSIQIAKNLEHAGVDILNISSGIGGWRRPQKRIGEGYLVEDASVIQSHVNLPVIGVGGIETGTYIDQQLQQNSFTLAAVGRAILKDPQHWGQDNLRS